MLRIVPLSCLVASVACKEPADEGPADSDDPTDTDDTDDPTDTDADTSAPIDTAPTDTALETPVFDCGTIPLDPIAFRMVPNARAYHGLAFTADDKLVGSDNNALMKVDYAGAMELVAPNLGMLQQMDWIDDGSGDLAVAFDNDGSIRRVMPNGSTSVLASNMHAYGLVSGPDGKIYVANMNNIYRIDPATGDTEMFLGGGGRQPKVVDFNREGTKLYFGTIGNGDVWEVALDASYDVVGAPVRVATGIGGWHDGLGVDVCGNIYVADFNTRGMYRISVNGAIDKLLDPGNPDNYGHGLAWGVPTGGWKETALYIPQPYNGNSVAEVDIGVPSRRWQGDVIGVVPF